MCEVCDGSGEYKSFLGCVCTHASTASAAAEKERCATTRGAFRYSLAYTSPPLRRRALKQNAWSTSSYFLLQQPFYYRPARLVSLRCQLDHANYYQAQVHFLARYALTATNIYQAASLRAHASIVSCIELLCI